MSVMSVMSLWPTWEGWSLKILWLLLTSSKEQRFPRLFGFLPSHWWWPSDRGPHRQWKESQLSRKSKNSVGPRYFLSRLLLLHILLPNQILPSHQILAGWLPASKNALFKQGLNAARNILSLSLLCNMHDRNRKWIDCRFMHLHTWRNTRLIVGDNHLITLSIVYCNNSRFDARQSYVSRHKFSKIDTSRLLHSSSRHRWTILPDSSSNFKTPVTWDFLCRREC